ncbi:hypothetical protein GCM10007036_19570 [Alsobacter metallidurans]|uniref:Exo-alpha-sialidase n=1 Tax=Alsobacter metallidurans TaxID=340221 RepID=A0A917MJH3_9HYPH|nr:sialidase family protein [Alsobacter metallidurans]GGH17828.1 hypothetical protein GCM10007036_19570 [Alsobacter metallidurans]
MHFTLPDFANPKGPGLYVGLEVQVSHSTASQSRSESDLAVNPRNPSNLVGASKRFDEPQKYHFHLSPFYSLDGGETWGESTLPMLPGWQGMTDPAVTFDANGAAYLLGEPLSYGQDLTGLGMVVYRSGDGGQTWSNPVQLTTSDRDDKQWMAADDRPESPFHGNVYAVWGANQNCGFARSTDGGLTWRGPGAQKAAGHLDFSVYAPAIVTDSNGWIHIFDISPASKSSVRHLRSKDGGATFEKPVVVADVQGLEGLSTSVGGFPILPNGHFRVRTMVTAAVGSGGTLVIAWPELRDGVSRIFYRVSRDGGQTWEGPTSGSPLIPSGVLPGQHCFMPQLAATPSGTVGCAFYAFGQEFGAGPYLLNLYLSASYDDAGTFPHRRRVTKHGWNPDVNAPWSHGDRNLLFIGDYFGLAATDEVFVPFWTDTRTGVQEIFCAQVLTTEPSYIDVWVPDEWPLVFRGVAEDGGGLVIVGGKIVRVPPRSPVLGVLEAVSVIEGASAFSSGNADLVRRAGAAELLARAEALHLNSLGANAPVQNSAPPARPAQRVQTKRSASKAIETRQRKGAGSS